MVPVSAGLTRVEALDPQGQTGLGDGDELQSDVELAPPEVTQPSGSTKLCDLNPHTQGRRGTVNNIVFM